MGKLVGDYESEVSLMLSNILLSTFDQEDTLKTHHLNQIQDYDQNHDQKPFAHSISLQSKNFNI